MKNSDFKVVIRKYEIHIYKSDKRYIKTIYQKYRINAILKRENFPIKIRNKDGDPGCPVARTWHFHYMGPGSIPDEGAKIL